MLKADCVYAYRQLWLPQGQFRLLARSTSCHWSNFATQPWNDLASSSESNTQHWINDARPPHPQNPKENVDTTPTCVTLQSYTQSAQTKKKRKVALCYLEIIQLSSSSILLLFPPFIFNGDRGTDGESSYPTAPLLCFPHPWCLYLNYISALASSATLFIHSSIHIYLACTCLVPTRVTWRERTHKTEARTPLCTNSDQLTPICSSSPLRRWESRRAMEMSERGGRK